MYSPGTAHTTGCTARVTPVTPWVYARVTPVTPWVYARVPLSNSGVQPGYLSATVVYSPGNTSHNRGFKRVYTSHNRGFKRVYTSLGVLFLLDLYLPGWVIPAVSAQFVRPRPARTVGVRNPLLARVPEV